MPVRLSVSLCVFLYMFPYVTEGRFGSYAVKCSERAAGYGGKDHPLPRATPQYA